jgi:hypothetical protein
MVAPHLAAFRKEGMIAEKQRDVSIMGGWERSSLESVQHLSTRRYLESTSGWFWYRFERIEEG